MAKKITFEGTAKMIANLATRTDKGFAAGADDIADMRKDMATKEQLFALHTRVTSIETQLRGMEHVKLQARVADLEEQVFGKTRV